MKPPRTLSFRSGETTLTQWPLAALVVVAVLGALGVLSVLGCGNDLPPGARPIGDSGGAGAAPAAAPGPSSASSAAPLVVALDPADGATGVDPGRKAIAVTFDRPMDPDGWAWVTETGTTPPPTTGEPSFTLDGKTNVLPVDLAPSTTYTIWVNSEQHLLFRGLDQQPAEPVRWTFTTGPE